jgi:cytochrome c biogenesis protein CcdA
MKTVPLICLILLFLSPVAGADIYFSSGEWDFGEIHDEKPERTSLTIENSNGEKVTVSIVPTCGCLAADPLEFTLLPGKTKTITLTFDPAGYSGKVEKEFIIRSTSPSLRKAIFVVHGTVIADSAQDEPGPPRGEQAPTPASTLTIEFYYTPGCRECRTFMTSTVPKVEEKLHLNIEVEKKDVLTPRYYKELLREYDKENMGEISLPVVVFSGHGIRVAGMENIERTFLSLTERALEQRAPGTEEQGTPDEQRATGTEEQGTPKGEQRAPGTEEQAPEKQATAEERPERMRGLALIPVLAAGLTDGVNPCAFATILFLLSALAVAGRSRKEIFVIGLFFTLAVFVSYYLIGIGLFSALRKAESYPLVATVIRYALVALLFVLAGLSLYDFSLIRRGKAAAITLQLPKVFKQRIHASIRGRIRSSALITTALILGVLVSLFELACTGQIYFPTIAYVVKVEQSVRSFLYLALYNIGFIVPLVAVFSLTYAGVGSQRLVRFFNDNMGRVKLVTAGLFVALALLMLLLFS